MSKVIGTRKLKATALMKTLELGPRIGASEKMISPEQARRECKLWLETWVIPEVKRLVPELRSQQ